MSTSNESLYIPAHGIDVKKVMKTWGEGHKFLCLGQDPNEEIGELFDLQLGLQFSGL